MFSIVYAIDSQWKNIKTIDAFILHIKGNFRNIKVPECRSFTSETSLTQIIVTKRNGD